MVNPDTMQTQTFRSRSFEKLRQLGNSFIQGFLHIIGAEENPYEKDVQKIFNRTNNEKLKEDFEKVNKDFIKAFNKYKNQYPQ
jgi:hypothetical protein